MMNDEIEVGQRNDYSKKIVFLVYKFSYIILFYKKPVSRNVTLVSLIIRRRFPST